MFGTQTPGAFGTTAPAASGGGGLFGTAPAATSTPAPGGFSFGQQQQPQQQAAAATPAAGFSGFGAFGGGSTAPQTPSLFGTAAPAPGGAPAGGLFTGFGQPQQQQQQQQQMQFPAFNVGGNASTLLPQRELDAIHAAVTKPGPGADNTAYRFRTLVIKGMADASFPRSRPLGVDEPTWRDALSECGGERNTDNLWPELKIGFEGLCDRYAEQSAALQQQDAFLASLVQEAARRARRRQVAIVARLERLRSVQEEQVLQLLRASRLGDALDARAAPWAPETLRPQEVELQDKLKRLHGRVSASACGARSLSSRVEALRAAAKHRSGAGGGDQAGEGQGSVRLDDDSMAKATRVLGEQADALRALAQVVKRDARYVAILEQEASGNSSAME
jgi:hypothetical protein